MYALQHWNKNKPFVIQHFAYEFATTADFLPELFTQTFSGKMREHKIPLHPLKNWLLLYRQHHRISGWFVNLMGSEVSEFSPEQIEYTKQLAEGARLLKIHGAEFFKEAIQSLSQEEWKAQLEAATIQRDALLRIAEKEYIDDLHNVTLGPEVKERFIAGIFQEIESAFFLKVWSPCWLLYRQTPTRLYRSARLGNRDALEKLLRLDSSILHDPSIGTAMLRIRAKRPSLYVDLLASATKKPKVKITREKIKVSLAGFLSCLSAIIKQPLIEPDIRAFFDAVAEDRGKGKTDFDLPYGQEAFARAINRERVGWDAFLRPDKKK